MIQNGDRVAFCGYPSPGGPAIGDQGRVVDEGHTGSAVRWTSGALSGTISSLVDNNDLVVNGSLAGVRNHHAAAHVDEVIEARSVIERTGSVGLLNALNTEGRLANFQSIGEDALAMVALRIRQDPSIAPVLAQLDEDEAGDFVAVASLQLLRDAFGKDA